MGIRIAIVDSGIFPDHPHVDGVAGGISLVGGDFLDRIGHGTAVAGAIRERVPSAELFAVKIFDRRLSAKMALVIRAIEWCAAEGMDVINLSLGTARPIPTIAAAPVVVTVPNILDGSIAVLPDADCPRASFYFDDGIYYASPYPRSIPGVPVERNLQGASFAVANMTGFVAEALMAGRRNDLAAALASRAMSGRT